MVQNKLFNSDIKLPKYDNKLFLKFLLSFLIPNIIIFVFAYSLSANIPLINIDYILPALLLTFNYKFVKFIGILLFLFFMTISGYLVVLQFFPMLEDFSVIKDLLQFTSQAPKEYLWLMGSFVIVMVFVCIVAYRLNKQQQKFYPICFALLLLLLFKNFGIDNPTFYIKNSDEMESGINIQSYAIYSQYYKFRHLTDEHWIRRIQDTDSKVVLMKWFDDKKTAANHLIQPYNDKIVFIIAESWGISKNDTINENVLSELYKQKHLLDFVSYDEIFAPGLTVEAEFRELCGKRILNGINVRTLDKDKLSDCLPAYFNNNGYKTVAIHGASSAFYHRKEFYPALGFQQTFFRENTTNKKSCYAFHATCDSELFDIVSQSLKEDKKQFIYWLTVSSHFPYKEKNITDSRFMCNQFDISAQLCRNLKLNTQFFDQLSQVIQQPEWRGVEVVVVGDHHPPVIKDKESLFKNFKMNYVSFVHFKVKD